MLFVHLRPFSARCMIQQELLKRIGRNLTKARKSRNLSLRQLSALCTVDHAHIGKIEKGQSNVTIGTICELADALEIDPEDLFKFD
jgi:transcriptional regulator with XRE-family HTH domain